MAGERVVGIKRDMLLGQRRHHHLQCLPVLLLQVQMLAQRRVEVRGRWWRLSSRTRAG